MITLGISCYYHDSAICLIKDGEILFAAQEERYSRVKHDSRFPEKAILKCFEYTKIKPEQIDTVVFYEKPFLSYERVVETILDLGSSGFSLFYDSLTKMLRTKLFFKSNFKRELKKLGINKFELKFSEHHYSHAVSAFTPSPYKSAVIICMDGVGEWDTSTIWHGRNGEITKLRSMEYPHSIGLFYSMFTEYCGFKSNSGEYKLMGLAPYGEAKYVKEIKDSILSIHEDGSICLNTKILSTDFRSDKVLSAISQILGKPARGDNEITQFYKDVAASVQYLCEEVIEKVVDYAIEITGERQICLAGGVALNCVANGKLAMKYGWGNIWVQPAAGDCGGAIGAALTQHFDDFKNFSPYLGEEYDYKRIIKVLEEKELTYHKLSIEKVAQDLVNNNVVAIFDGRMEFGPRALGSRSILAKASSKEMKATLNEKVKKREGFRPFAPIVLESNSKTLFELDNISPYMLFTTDVKTDAYPAITHVNGSARVQTVGDQNLKIYSILEKYESLYKEQVLVNTSFNIRGEPIVSSPENALDCFFDSGIDCLILGDYYLTKLENNKPYSFYNSREFKKD